MALFTKKGDDGSTSLYGQSGSFGCDQRISKSSGIAEALGSLDEVNSFLGLAKVQSAYLGYKYKEKNFSEIVHMLQKNLFIVQAELAGAEKTIDETKVKELEEIINGIEKEMPPIKSFFISGGPECVEEDKLAGVGLGSLFDISRTIARRAERRVVQAVEEESNKTLFDGNPSSEKEKLLKRGKVGKHTLAFMNRLSSILYALARYSNHLAKVKEESPDYK